MLTDVESVERMVGAMKNEYFKIENGIPIPPKRSPKYPFLDMAVGDSFEFPGEIYNTLRSCAASVEKRKGWKFAVRKNAKSKTGRIWRIK